MISHVRITSKSVEQPFEQRALSCHECLGLVATVMFAEEAAGC